MENNIENTEERRWLRVQARSTVVSAVFTVVIAVVAGLQYSWLRGTERPRVVPTMHKEQAPAISLEAGYQIQAVLAYVNFGKRPAHAKVKQVVMFSAKKLVNGPGFAGVVEKHLIIWPQPVETTSSVVSQGLVGGEAVDFRGGRGSVYVQAEVVYPEGRTGVCMEWPVIPNQGYPAQPTLGQREPCTNDSTNYAE